MSELCSDHSYHSASASGKSHPSFLSQPTVSSIELNINKSLPNKGLPFNQVRVRSLPKGPYLIENEMGLEEGFLAELYVNRGRMILSHQNHPVSNNPLATLRNTRTSSVFVYLFALGPGDRVPGLGHPKRVLYH